MQSPAPRNVNLERLRAANARAQQFIGKANALQDRFNTLQKQHNFTFLGGKIVQQLAGVPEADRTQDKEAEDQIDDLENALERFDGIVNRTEREATAAREQTPNDDPVAEQLDGLRNDIAKLRKEAGDWRHEEANALGVGTENVPSPDTFKERRVDDLQRLIDAFLHTLDGNEPSAATATPRTPSPTFGTMVDALARSRQPSTPMRTERVDAPPTTEPAPTESVARPRSGPALAPDNEPWPTTQAEFRLQFTYSPERFGSRENFARHLASRLNTPERMNQFLENMFNYTQARDIGQRQRMVNAGRERYENNEKWIPPLEFLTTYDASGKMHGDCEDVALAFAYIKQLQGKPAFALETSTSTRDASGGLHGRGHALSASFEPDGSVHIIDTTGIEGRSSASVQITQRQPGETDEQLLTRAYRSATDSGRQFDPRAIYGVISMPNGDGFNLPGNLAFVRRHIELQPMLEAGNYRGVLGVIDQEIARDPTNLNLRLSKIQMLVLANAPRSEVTAVINALAGPPKVEKPTQFNVYSVNITHRILLEQSPQYGEEHLKLTAHCDGAGA